MELKTYDRYLNESIDINKNKAIEDFVGLLFQSRDIAHILHLYTNKYATHKTLNEYYDGILNLIDVLVEQYQGIYGKIKISIPSSDSSYVIENVISKLNLNLIQLKKTLNENEGSIANTLDTIQELFSTTIYKLKELI